MRIHVSLRCAFATIVCFAMANGASIRAQSLEHDSRDMAAALMIATELSRCPVQWLYISEGNTEIQAGLLKYFIRLAASDTTTIRSGIQLYLKQTEQPGVPDLHIRANVFVFLRVVFDIPDKLVDIESGGHTWTGSPGVPGKANLLWPLRESDGKLSLVGIGSEMWYGTPYDPLKDFDWLLKRFGRRKLS